MGRRPTGWTVADENYVCACGRRYRIEKMSVPMRDKDSEECPCGETIIEWNGGVMFQAIELTK